MGTRLQLQHAGRNRPVPCGQMPVNFTLVAEAEHREVPAEVRIVVDASNLKASIPGHATTVVDPDLVPHRSDGEETQRGLAVPDRPEPAHGRPEDDLDGRLQHRDDPGRTTCTLRTPFARCGGSSHPDDHQQTSHRGRHHRRRSSQRIHEARPPHGEPAGLLPSSWWSSLSSSDRTTASLTGLGTTCARSPCVGRGRRVLVTVR